MTATIEAWPSGLVLVDGGEVVDATTRPELGNRWHVMFATDDVRARLDDEVWRLTGVVADLATRMEGLMRRLADTDADELTDAELDAIRRRFDPDEARVRAAQGTEDAGRLFRGPRDMGDG